MAVDGVTWAIVLAAGGGERFGARKQFEMLGRRRAVDHAVAAAAAACDAVVVVLPRDVPWEGQRVGTPVTGGATRAASVRRGLAAVPDAADVVVIHDAAHPLAPPALFESVISAVRGGADAAVPVVPATETVVHLDGNRIGAPVPREGLVLVQTPHAFRASVLRAAHAGEPAAIDDASLLQAGGATVVAVVGDAANVHVTTFAEHNVAHRLLGDG